MTRERLQKLREQAEKILAGKRIHKDELAQEFNEILQELEENQLELERQNYELGLALEEGIRQKHLFSSLFEAAPVAYISLTKEGVILNINKTGLQLFNKGRSMMLGVPLAAFVSYSDLPSFYQFLRNTADAKNPQSSQLQFLKSEEELFTGLLQGVFVQTEGIGQQLYLTIADITQEKASDLALEQSKLRLELALEASTTGICELDPVSGKYKLDHNASLFLEFDKQDFYGDFDRLTENVFPEDIELLENEIEAALSKDVPLGFEFRVRTPAGEFRNVQVRGRLVDEGTTRKILLATFTDITDRMQFEEQTRRLKDEQDLAMLQAGLTAVEKEKLRMSEALHNGVAQVLYATRIHLDLLHAKAPELSISKVVELIDQTIRDVRDLSFELTPAVLAEFGLKAAVDEMIHRLETEELKFKSDIKIKGLPATTQLSIYRITQELVNNAVKHSFCSKIHIEITQDKDCVKILVADNGRGFDHSASYKIGGNGLSSIRNRLRLYGGELEIRPNAPKGTRVLIQLNIF